MYQTKAGMSTCGPAFYGRYEAHSPARYSPRRVLLPGGNSDDDGVPVHHHGRHHGEAPAGFAAREVAATRQRIAFRLKLEADYFGEAADGLKIFDRSPDTLRSLMTRPSPGLRCAAIAAQMKEAAN